METWETLAMGRRDSARGRERRAAHLVGCAGAYAGTSHSRRTAGWLGGGDDVGGQGEGDGAVGEDEGAQIALGLGKESLVPGLIDQIGGGPSLDVREHPRF